MSPAPTAARAPVQAGRITVVLDAQAQLALRYDDVDVGTHPAAVPADCQALFGPSPENDPSVP